VGYYAKKIFQKPWLADYRDLWIENHTFSGLWPFTVFEKFLEKKIIRSADQLTTVSHPLAEILSHKFPEIPVDVIENGFDPESMDEVPEDYFVGQPKKIRMVYTGSIYPAKRDPSPLFQAIRELSEDKKITPQQFEVLFYGSYASEVENLINSFHLEGFLFEDDLAFSTSFRLSKPTKVIGSK